MLVERGARTKSVDKLVTAATGPIITVPDAVAELENRRRADEPDGRGGDWGAPVTTGVMGVRMHTTFFAALTDGRSAQS